MASKLREAGLDTENLAEAEREAVQGVQELSAQQEQLARMRNHISDIAQSFTVLSMAAGEALKPINAITSALEASVQTAAGFEYTMSAVEAVSGATANEAAALAAMAKEMGATTVFTAQECAEAMQTQALAGWDVQDMLSGMPGVIKLAAAAGEDLASMTSLVTPGQLLIILFLILHSGPPAFGEAVIKSIKSNIYCVPGSCYYFDFVYKHIEMLAIIIWYTAPFEMLIYITDAFYHFMLLCFLASQLRPFWKP